MEKKQTNKLNSVILFSLVMLMLAIILSILAIFSGAIMKLFGFEYKSISSIILYFIISAIISFPLETVAGALPKTLHSLGFITPPSKKVMLVTLDTICTYSVMAVVDIFIPNVTASNVAIIVISLLMALLSLILDEHEILE